MSRPQPKVYVLYENPDWLPPLVRELERVQVPYTLWEVVEGAFDLDGIPPEGVFLNRMSPSSHTRGHVHSVALTWAILAWLEAHGRRVVNGSRAFALEVSKVHQYAALRASGIRVPHTVAVSGGPEKLKAAARRMSLPFITKHNRGGKGLGVQLFRSYEAFDAYVVSSEFAPSPDGITLLQQYVESPEPFITRVEIVDGRFLYALRSDTSSGFELCPADRCQADPDCPLETDPDRPRFSLREDFSDSDPLVGEYIAFMSAQSIDVAGIEFVEDADGLRYTYDINGTTNYNPQVEAAHGLNGMAAIVSLLRRELERVKGEVPEPVRARA